MRRNGVLFSQEAARAQQIRAEVGRLLRQHYDTILPPMSDRLANVIKKMEQSESQSVLAFRRGIPNEQAR